MRSRAAENRFVVTGPPNLEGATGRVSIDSSSTVPKSAESWKGRTGTTAASPSPADWAATKKKRQTAYKEKQDRESKLVDDLNRKLGLSTAASVAPKAQAGASANFSGKCVNVVRGDVIQVQNGGKVVTVRLYAVKSPVSPKSIGSQAAGVTRGLLLGKQVKVFPKPGRESGVSAWVFAGRTCANSELVKRGLATWNRAEAPKETKLASLQQQAKGKKLGLWAGT